MKAVARWLQPRPPVDDARWVVLDVESSGLDTRRDRLLAIAAVALHRTGGRPHIRLADSFETVLRQPGVTAGNDKTNILLHGIGVGAQRAGVEPANALLAFASWVARSPLIAFHAAFDRTMLERSCRETGCPRLTGPWLDLAPLAAVLNPDVHARSLDDWLGHFEIPCAVRHQAASDTLATAELLMRLWPRLQAHVGRTDFRAVQRVAAASRWLRVGPSL